MAQNYTRQSSFNDGDTITASLFNDEYNQLVNSFTYSSTSASSTGHRHDGSAGQGGNIFKIGDLDFLNKIEVDSTNNRWGFYVEVSSAAVEQIRIQDGAVVPVTDNDIDLGTTSLEFKDLFIDGTAHIDTLDVDENATVAGTLGVTGTTTLTGNVTTTNNLSVGGNLTVTGTTTFNGGTITMGDAATDNVVFGADVDSNIIPDDDDTYDLGSSSQEWRNLYIDGTANIDSLVADTADINGGTIDGATIATSDVTIGSGKTLDVSAGTLTLADNQISGDKVEGGTIAATTITSLASTTVDTTNLEVTNIKAKDGTSAGSIADTTGVVTLASSILTTADINGGTIDGTVIGGTTPASITGTAITGTSFVIGSANISESELETIDGITAGTVAASKAVVVDANKDATGFRNITITGELDAATLDVSGNIDVDGVTNLDVVDIDGAVDMASTLSVASNITVGGTVDGRDVAADGTKLDGIEASADVTDTANVTAAGAVMDSELTSEASVKALNQGVATTDSPTFAGLTTTADVSFGDNGKAIFGAGSDLQIFHNGSGSYISDEGTGDLFLRSDNDLYVTNSAGSETKARFTTNGAVRLFYDNAEKLATTSTGIDVTGTVTADGLTVDGDSFLKASGTNTKPLKVFSNNTATNNTTTIEIGDITGGGSFVVPRASIIGQRSGSGSGGILTFTTGESSAGTLTNRININDGGDISFYNDAGTSQDLYWDASTSQLGLGTTSPAHEIHINSASPQIRLDDSDGTNTYGDIQYNGTSLSFITRGGASDYGLITFVRTDGTSTFNTAQINAAGDYRFFDDTGTEGMRWDASTSRLGLGTTLPTYRLETNGDDNMLKLKGSSGQFLSFTDDSTNDLLDIDAVNGDLTFSVNGDEKVKIENNGNVGIGTDVPAAQFHVENSATTGATLAYFDDSGAGTTGRLQFTTTGGNSSDAVRVASVNRNLQLGNASGDGITIENSTGNVGIGTSGPARPLHVAGIAKADAGFEVGSSYLYEGATDQVNLRLGTDGPYLEFIDAGSNVAEIGNASGPLGLTSANTERVRIDNSGNVVIGDSSAKTRLQSSGAGTANAPALGSVSSNAPLYLTNNDTAYGLVVGTNTADGHVWLQAQRTDGTATAYNLTLNEAGGNVGISNPNPDTLLHIGNINATNATGQGRIKLEDTSTSLASAGGLEFVTSAFGSGYGWKVNSIDATGVNLVFATRQNSTTWAEKARLDYNGNLLVGTTDSLGTGGLTVRPNITEGAAQINFNRATTTNTSFAVVFQNAGTDVGSISYSNTATAYNTSSDQRLKENIVDAPSASDDIDAIQVRSFDWKVDGSHRKYGMIAQELNTVVPDAVTIPDDPEKMAGVDYSKLVPMLVKEIQSLRARVAQLEGAN